MNVWGIVGGVFKTIHASEQKTWAFLHIDVVKCSVKQTVGVFCGCCSVDLPNGVVSLKNKHQTLW